jgi:hypothetical protein
MATVLAQVSEQFPVGTTVGAYLESGWPDVSKAPPLAAVTTAVVAANGSLTFNGLPYSVDYIAGADIGAGVWHHLGFTSEPAVGGVVRTGSKTWDPASTADAAMTSTTVTVTGARVGDIARAGFTTSIPAGGILAATVTADDTVTVTYFNKTGGVSDLASGTLTVQTYTI